MSMIDISPAERKIADRVDPGITGALAVSDTGTGVAFSNVGEMMEFAKMMAVANSGVRKHLRGNPGACLAIVTQALEWGMSAFAVANKSYFVNDQIAFESQLVQAVILKRAPIKGRIKFDFSGEGQTRKVRAWARDRDDPDDIYEIETPMLKDIKVKNSPLWVADPDQQLAYYGGRALCRRHFPDVLLGVYTPEEMADRPAIGPDQAKDVTPSRSLSGKLDALANMADPEQTAPMLSKPGASPATDQMPTSGDEDDPAVGLQSAEHDQAAAPIAAGGEKTSADGPVDPVPSPREDLLADIRDRIEAGERVNAILNGLGSKRDLLTDADVKALKSREKKAQGGQE